MHLTAAAVRGKTRVWRTMIICVIALMALGQWGLFAMPDTTVRAETAVNRTGTVTVSAANVRTVPTTVDNTAIAKASRGQSVLVLSSVQGEYIAGYGDVWYFIRYTDAGGTQIEGYTVAGFITLDPIPEPDPEPDPAFEAYLDEQGFPESYRDGLRRLHAKFPEWRFVASDTRLDFTEAVEIMHTPGYTLISNSVNDAWKSLDPESYNWYTNTWKAYDGSTWVMCSRDLIAYYMDPRNMLSEINIFQFETLNYQPDVHHQAGVEVILRNSFMSNTSFTFLDPETGAEATMSYGDAFMAAAAFSNVSPYHLAARSLVEVGSSGSASVTGLFSEALAAAGLPVTTEYDGYYNFYNIGASASTEPLGNIRNGLEYAKLGSDRKEELTATDIARLIPWNDRRRAIAGGSVVIGSGYINASVGTDYADQNTLYFQKFNVAYAPVARYWHLYMGAILAPVVEGAKLYKAYSEMGDLQKPITFLIPIFQNMPEANPKPPETGNPNNWLQTLGLDGFSLTPSFDPALTNTYSLIVPYDISSVQLSAAPVSSRSQVSGTGTRQLVVGENILDVVVTAENGDKRTYAVNVVREQDPNAPTPTATPTVMPGATVTPTPTPSPTVTVAPTVTPTLAPAELSSSVLKIEGDQISGLDPVDGANTVTNISSQLALPAGYSLSVTDITDNPLQSSDLIGTGCKIKLMNGPNTTRIYQIALYGDVTGDGKINAIDLTLISWHMLKKQILEEIFEQVSDVTRDGKINAIDLTVIVRHTQKVLVLEQ